MSILGRKLIRDLWQAKWQYLSVAVMIVLGVAVYCAATLGYRNLDASYEHSYDKLNFEDLGVSFQSSSPGVIAELGQIPGVADIEGRLVHDILISLDADEERTLIGRLISVPTDRQPRVNALKVVEGRYLRPGSRREVLLEKSFAEAHELGPGDSLDVVEGQTTVTFEVAGIVISPEYVYVVRSKQDLIPAPKTFGVMFVSDQVLGPLIGEGGLINEARITLTEEASLGRVSREVERILDARNPQEPIPREEQPSHQLLRQDIEGFRVYAFLFPLLFFTVSGLTIFTLLSRTIHLQRGVIGLLRALGFSQFRVVLHYLASACALGLGSGVVGVVLGIWMGQIFTEWYLSFVSVGFVQYLPSTDIAVTGILIASIVCVAAGAIPAKSAAKVKPAEAMRGTEPDRGRVWTPDRIFPNLRLLWRVPIRNVFRRRSRSLSTVFGIVAGIALIMSGRGMLDSSTEIIGTLLGSTFEEDLRVDFTVPQDADVASTISRWSGVHWAEGTLDVPVEFMNGDLRYSALLTGVETGSRIHVVTDSGGDRADIPRDALLLGRTLKSRLAVEKGDLIQVRLPGYVIPEEPIIRTVRVAGFTADPIGTIAYTSREHVWDLFHSELGLSGNAITSLRIQTDPVHEREIRQRIAGLPDASVTTSSADLKEMIQELMGQFERFILVMLVFGSLLAFSIVFNTVTINVLERKAEAATLRTLGVSRLQLASMVTLESLILSLIGVAVGLPVGRWFVGVLVTAAQTEEQSELFNFEIMIYPQTYVITALLILGVTLISQIPALAYIGRIDLAKSTKERST